MRRLVARVTFKVKSVLLGAQMMHGIARRSRSRSVAIFPVVTTQSQRPWVFARTLDLACRYHSPGAPVQKPVALVVSEA